MARVYVAKAQKVNADQFVAADLPWPPHVCTQAAPIGICQAAPIFPDWRPHVHGAGAIYELHDTDWITVPAAFPSRPPDVLTDAQFTELYGNQGGPNVAGG